MHYHARDMAVVRGHIANIPVVLSSATPSLETEVNARRGRYQRIALPERFGGQRLPSVEAIDLRQAPPPRGRFISPVLAEAVKNAHRAARAGAAVSQSPRLRAADAVPRLRLPLFLPELRCLAGRSSLPQVSWSATIAASPCRIRRIARNATRKIPSSPSARASSGWKRRCANCFPTRACWCCRAIWSPRSSACARNSPTSPQAYSTSSSARSLSPRATISRCSIWSASSMPISA